MENVADKIKKRQRILIEYLEELAHEQNTSLGSTPDCEVIIDTQHNHFQLTRIGWHDRKYNFYVLMHLSIKPDGKVWIQKNNTEILIDEDLERRGIPKSEMVLGFRPEYWRAMSDEFAVA
ncbi:MAG: element excision factor XisI family protein [Bacteroidota bacterium]